MSDWDEKKIASKLDEILLRQVELDRKLDEVLAFTAATTQAVAPFLTGGKGARWLALVAKSKRGGV